MSKTVCLKLAKKIRDLRSAKNLTQEQLSDRSGISTKYLQNLESKNPKVASILTLEKLAKGFNIPLNEILKF